jgi:hypothetical protein
MGSRRGDVRGGWGVGGAILEENGELEGRYWRRMESRR